MPSSCVSVKNVAANGEAPVRICSASQSICSLSARACSRTSIAEHGADLELHGHAHAGSFEGQIGDTPVYNVALHVIGRDFWLFDVEASPRPQTTAVV
jgi:hypothetical protein